MYKGTSRFRQAMACKGRSLTSRNLVMSDSAPVARRPFRTGLHKRLDAEVESATRAPQVESKPQLVKRPRRLLSPNRHRPPPI
jgi:hypothetical protein